MKEGGKKHFSSRLVWFVFLKAAARSKQEPQEGWTSIPGTGKMGRRDSQDFYLMPMPIPGAAHIHAQRRAKVCGGA